MLTNTEEMAFLSHFMCGKTEAQRIQRHVKGIDVRVNVWNHVFLFPSLELCVPSPGLNSHPEDGADTCSEALLWELNERKFQDIYYRFDLK